MKGHIESLTAERGFGFITAEDGRDYFFHRSGLEGISIRDLSEDQPVEFEPVESEKGPRAEKVLVGASAPPGGG